MDFRTNKKTGKPYPIKNYGDKFTQDEKELEKQQKQQADKKLEADQKRHELAQKITDKIFPIINAERRENILKSSKGARPQYMREDPTTPLIREVPFGPDTRRIENLEHGNPKNFDHVSHITGQGFNKFEAEQDKLPKEKQFPKFGDISGEGSKIEFNTTTGKDVDANSFRVIPHGGISIPKEQERIVRSMEQRNWEEHGKLKSRSKRTQQSDIDAKEIALDLLFDEKPSRFVNRETKKIRPNKPVRSDFASIITAKKGFKGIVRKESIFVVAENDKPEYVEVRPLKPKEL